MSFQDVIAFIVSGFEAAGVGALVIGSGLALYTFARALLAGERRHGARMPPAYRNLRRGLGRAILLGLELLVAADIIRSIAVTPTLQSVGVLGLIVLIRTFLSWSLEVEVTGRWPWEGTRPGALARMPDGGDGEEAADPRGRGPP
ncbi:MAG TPA: DUF1622 domain-containing protein [Anaerolineae bacterium]|nr:DUF1622 domain-containing protein [Anaerolineae bacterium]HOQ98282.1 DUF1622 domain-containing protein [Anaerolineae bacterium]HPL27613.1 DUF1622 domain-containing protein [Anaerolineae bacterium]